ncbi:MAG TPA: hypothetical protein ENJ82_00740 [Bacteroidetes bacterium]|nr:hypothetical protein [Bacteroidota bacterium]
MKRLSITLLTVALLLGITTTGCKKYEDGPAISIKSKRARATNNWKAKNVFQDGVDYTAWFTDWSIDMGEDGRIVISDKDDNDSTITQAGFWDLVNDQKELRLLLTEPRVDPDQKYYTITRLTSKEFWFKELTDSTVWEFRLIPLGTESSD